MVDRVQDVTVGGDAFVVVEILEGLFEHDDEGRLCFGGCLSVRYKYVGAVTPGFLRSQPRGGGDVLQGESRRSGQIAWFHSFGF